MVNVAEARSPLVCPAACTVCAPGCADLGTSTGCVKFPVLSAMAEPAADVSNVRVTVSPAVKPEPVALALEVGGPAAGDTETVAASANAALAVTTRIRPNAKAEKELRIMARPPRFALRSVPQQTGENVSGLSKICRLWVGRIRKA